MPKRKLVIEFIELADRPKKSCTRLHTTELIQSGTFNRISLDSSCGKPDTKTTSSMLENLPNELLSHIYRLLDPASMLAFKFTSHTCHVATLKRDGTRLVKFKHALSERVIFQTMMIEIEASLPMAVKCQLLTCSGCFLPLGHGLRAQYKYHEHVENRRHGRRRVTRSSTFVSKTLDDLGNPFLYDSSSDSDVEPGFTFRCKLLPGHAHVSIVDTNGLLHDNEDLSADKDYYAPSVWNSNKCFPDDQFKRRRRDRMCMRCIETTTPFTCYLLSGRRQVRCNACKRFFDQDTGTMEQNPSEWQNQEEHIECIKNGAITAVDIVCSACFDLWEVTAGGEKDILTSTTC